MNELQISIDFQKEENQILKDTNHSKISELEKTKIDLNSKNSELVKSHEENVIIKIMNEIYLSKTLYISIYLRLS